MRGRGPIAPARRSPWAGSANERARRRGRRRPEARAALCAWSGRCRRGRGPGRSTARWGGGGARGGDAQGFPRSRRRRGHELAPGRAEPERPGPGRRQPERRSHHGRAGRARLPGGAVGPRLQQRAQHRLASGRLRGRSGGRGAPAQSRVERGAFPRGQEETRGHAPR